MTPRVNKIEDRTDTAAIAQRACKHRNIGQLRFVLDNREQLW